MKKCQQTCSICPYVLETKSVKGPGFNWTIRGSVNCKTKNIVYMIICNKDKCKMQYIGETNLKLRKRILQHRGYIQNNMLSQATGSHFNLPGHDESNMTVLVLERVKKNDELYRKEREKYLIRKFNTFFKGINRMP